MAFGPLLTSYAPNYVLGMDDILALPTGPLVDASLALARATESPPIVDHSIRTFLFARLLADLVKRPMWIDHEREGLEPLDPGSIRGGTCC